MSEFVASENSNKSGSSQGGKGKRHHRRGKPKMQEEKLIRNTSSKMVFIGLSLTDSRFHANVDQIKSDILSLTSSSSEGVDATANVQKYLTASPTIKLHLTLFRPFDTNDNDILKINDIINHTGNTLYYYNRIIFIHQLNLLATEHFNAPENANLIIEFTTIGNFNKGAVIYLKPLDNTAITSIKSLQALLYTRFKDQGLSIPEPTEELHATLGKTRGRGKITTP